MKRTRHNSLRLGVGAVLVATLLGSSGWAQHHGGGHGGGHSGGHGGGHSGGHGGGTHSGFGGHGGGGHSSFGGHGYGGHSGYGHSSYGHSGYGSHSILSGHGYGSHSSYGSHSILGGHGYGGYGHGGLGLHFSSGYGHHSYYPHYDGHQGYYGSYPYYTDYGFYTALPYYGYTVTEPVVVARPVMEDSSIPNAAVASPIMQSSSNASASISNPSESDAYRQSAEKAFRAGQFGDAARWANHALVEDSGNVNLHLFLSHALFAVGDYRGAATAVHRAAAIGGTDKLGYHVKNWRDLYRNVSYTDAMSQLNRFVSENPDEAAARFLRGYHFMFLDIHSNFAARELAKAIELEPNDRLAVDLLAKLSDSDVEQPRLGAKTKGVQSESADSDSHEHAGHEHAGHEHP